MTERIQSVIYWQTDLLASHIAIPVDGFDLARPIIGEEEEEAKQDEE